MRDLHELIGHEVGIRRISAALRDYVERLGVPAVGAHLVTCSDESEIECVHAFQRHFVEDLLPTLGVAKKAAFRTSNLGGRYETGSTGIAEQHFATPESRNDAKCMVVKINGHVSVVDTPDGRRYGPMERYNTESNACGALHAVLAGSESPFAMDLRETMNGGGHDRIAALLDPQRVDPVYRYLFAAMVNSRLQADRALRDARSQPGLTPTVYVIAPCVTLNRPGVDGEILVGVWVCDERPGRMGTKYSGLGDDPSLYRVLTEGERVSLSDAGRE